MPNSNDQIDEPKVQKRLVLFFTGLDIAGPSRYHLMMRQQHRYYARRFNVPMSISPLDKNERPNSHFSSFTLEADWPEGKTLTQYYISDTQQEVEREAARSDFTRFPNYLYWYFRFFINGVLPPLFKRQIRAGIVFSVPLFGLIARFLLALILLIAAASLISFLQLSQGSSYALGGSIGLLIFLSVARLGRFFKTLYEPHLADSLIYQCRLTANKITELEKQIATFSQEAIEIINQEKPDEVLVIGHSCGCFHSLPAFKTVLDARRSGENFADYEIIHATFGSLLPYTTTYRKNEYFRALTVQLLEDNDANWIEYFAPQDPFSIPHIRLDQDYGFNLSTPLPARYQVRSAVFGEVFSAKKLDQFKYNPLRMHFQYLTANDVAGSYDFFYIITHPQSLANNLNANKRIQPDS
ncbi:MAG: hypothetical protein ABJO30_02005 [Hyphomicrobiales bacterium]